VRALVSSTDAGKVFDLRCELREGLIDFLCRNYPESLPRQSSVSEPPDEAIQHRRKLNPPHLRREKSTSAVQRLPASTPNLRVTALAVNPLAAARLRSVVRCSASGRGLF